MPLSQLAVSGKIAWSLLGNSSSPYPNAKTGPLSEIFNVLSPSLTTWTQLFSQEYVIFVAAPSGLAATLSTTTGTLTIGTPYYWTITATAPSNGTTVETTKSNQVTVTPTSGHQSATLTWPQVSQATGYKIYRTTTSGTYTTPALVATITSGSTLTYTDTGTAVATGAPPGSLQADFYEFALNSFTNGIGETVTPGHLFALELSLTGGTGATCLLTPGNTNGLAALFSGTTPGIFIPVSSQGGGLLLTGGTDYGGVVIDGTHNSLRFTNAGSGNLTASVVAVVGP